MLILIEESKTHNKPAAIHNAGECGIKNKVIEAKMAPIRKNGFLLPNFGLQVLSDKYPTIGCTNKPVKGAATQRPGMSSTSAPRV